jgi:integrase
MRIKKQGVTQWFNLNTHVRADAEKLAKDLLLARVQGRLGEAREAVRLRNPVQFHGAGQRRAIRPEAPQTSIGQVIESFRAAPLDITAYTRQGYIWALEKLITDALGESPVWTERKLSVLGEDLIYKYRASALRKAQGRGDSAMRRAKVSGASVMRQAKGIFTKHLLEYYRIEGKLELDMKAISAFKSGASFQGAFKNEYNPPDDATIARTFEALESSRDTHPDRYITCWLALGLGLRKGEIAGVRSDWFVTVDGLPCLELRAVIQRDGTESEATKNGQIAPRIQVVNGAWEKLEPRIKALPQGGHLISGDEVYRRDGNFREINRWLRAMGWQTQKAIHEMRAYAGCQVIMRDGIYKASQWMRHSSVAVTQKYYGRYLNNTISQGPMSVPAAPGAGAAKATVHHCTPLAARQLSMETISNLRSPERTITFLSMM